MTELEAARSNLSEDLDSKSKELVLLGKKVEELEQKLSKAESKQKVFFFLFIEI